MRVIRPCDPIMSERDPIEAFGLAGVRAPIISFVGGGGKTTTLEALALDYQNKEKPVIITTTTHMFYPDDRWVFTDSEDLWYIQHMANEHKALWVGNKAENRKISGKSMEILEQLEGLSMPLLIEADGSKRLPFKMPGEHEPVLYPGTTYVFGVFGLDALHRPIQEVAHRSERVCSFLEKKSTDTLEINDFVRVIQSQMGLMKSVEPQMKFYMILNKADSMEQIKDGLLIRNQLFLQGIKDVYLTSYR
ncbi:MAG: hypothetical protein PWP24_163 [Clostridiales bacterium]|nr:hypothetical protein [Clostridiales bacterium]